MKNIQDSTPPGYEEMDFFENRTTAVFGLLFIFILQCIWWLMCKIPYWVGGIVNWTKEIFFEFLVLLLCWSLSDSANKDQNTETGEEGI